MPSINIFGGSSSNATAFQDIGSGISSVGSGVSDIFAGLGDAYKAEGAELQEQSYQDAATLAGQNAQFTANSTAIKQAQADRQLFTSIGSTTAGVANAGFSDSGSALDILRESAQEGATTRAVIGQQGLVTEAGYEEQQQSYNLLAQASGVAAAADKEAETGDFISGAISGLASVAKFAAAFA